MGLDSTIRQRWLGAGFLVLALGMLIAGETGLKSLLARNHNLSLVYWLGCFAFTILAIVVAFRDLRSSRDRAVQEHRELLQSTLDEIATDAKGKRQKEKRNGKS